MRIARAFTWSLACLLAVPGGPGGERSARDLEVVHVGWKDPDERHIFRRAEKTATN